MFVVLLNEKERQKKKKEKKRRIEDWIIKKINKIGNS
jgi:hypothetical protein